MVITAKKVSEQERRILSFTPQLALAVHRYFQYVAENLGESPEASRLADFVDASLHAISHTTEDEIKFIARGIDDSSKEVQNILLELKKRTDADLKDEIQLKKLFTIIKTAPKGDTQVKFFDRTLELLTKRLQEEQMLVTEVMREQELERAA